MHYQNGHASNRVIPLGNFAIGNDATTIAVNATQFRVDSAHTSHQPYTERSAIKTDEVGALLIELRSLLSTFSLKFAELERENANLKRINLVLEGAHVRDKNLMELAGQVASVGGWELDLRTERLFLTQATCRILEFNELATPSFETASFESAIKFYAPEAKPIIRAAFEAAIADGTGWDLELPMVTAKGRAIWVRSLGRVLNEKGTAIRVYGAFQDITERKQTEQLRTSLETHLRESQKLEAVGSLAGGVAHDFNNILAAIIGNTDVALLSTESPDVTSRCLSEISKASIRGRELVRQILTFGRPRETERKLISILPVVEESVQLLRATLPARVALTLDCSNELPKVFADATQLEQVVVNLATNAFQAMAGQPGNIRIKIDAIQADEKLRELMQQNRRFEMHQVLRMVVADDGPGMEDSTVSRLFEPFFTTKPVGEGTGLGLAVVQGIIRTHQGAITVESKLGQGATFTIYLPATQGCDSLESSEATDGAEPIAPPYDNQPKPFVLYVDDDPAVLKSTTCLLEHQGFRVSGFSDQLAAMDALRSDLDKYDIVVADYNMPCVSGIEFARFVRTLSKRIPIVIITGLIDEALRNQAAGVGVEELIAKPFSLKSFCNKLQQIVISHSNQNR